VRKKVGGIDPTHPPGLGAYACPSPFQLAHVHEFGSFCHHWAVLDWNRDTAMPAEGNGDLQTLICVLVARPRRCMSHIVESCPLTKLNGGLSRLHSADEDAVSWLTSYGP